MNFFNKYKELFGVPDHAPIPSTRLSLNNSLFIEKPFVPAYRESLALNSKLKDMKKDYNELEAEIESISSVMRHNRRPSSKKGRELEAARERNQHYSSPNGNGDGAKPGNVTKTNDRKHVTSTDQNQDNRNNTDRYEQQVRAPDPLVKKRMTWLKDEQLNLNKHSEMNYIFNQKIKQENPKLRILADMPAPRAENFMFGTGNNSGVRVQQNEVYRPPANRSQSQVVLGNEPEVVNHDKLSPGRNQPQYSAALQRRQQARQNITSRREKLSRLLRTGSY